MLSYMTTPVKGEIVLRLIGEAFLPPTSAALLELKRWTPELEAALVVATLDLECRVAGTALHTATVLFRRGQLRSYVPLLTSIASKSLTAEKPFVRALTARLVHELLLYSALDQKLHVLRAMLEILSQDISYQVRQAAFYGSETDVGVSVDA